MADVRRRGGDHARGGADRFINLGVETEAKEDLILAELRAINARLDDLELHGREDADRRPGDATS